MFTISYQKMRKGRPQIFTCDQSRGEFKNNRMKEFAKEEGIQIIHSAAYNPEGNGKAERQVQAAKKIFNSLQKELVQSLENLKMSLFTKNITLLTKVVEFI